MSTTADNVTITDITWEDITEISSVTMLHGGGADIYLVDGEGDRLNLELSEDAAKALRNELLELYPIEDDEESEETEEAEPTPAEVTSNGSTHSS